MVVQKNREGYTNVVFNYNIPDTVTLLYDKPLDKEGDYGKYYIFKIVSEDDEVGSMLIGGKYKGEEFKSFAEHLMECKAGDKIEIVKTEQKAKNGRSFNLYKLTKLGTRDVSEFHNEKSTFETAETIELSDTEKHIVEQVKNQITGYDKEKILTYKKPLVDQMVKNGEIDEVRASFIFDKVIIK